MTQGGGLALEDEDGVFIGGVRRGQVAEVRALGGLPRFGRVTQITRTFQWSAGGGNCSEGTIF